MHSDSKNRRSFLALLFTAGDVRRYAALNATPPRLHYQDVRTRLLLRDGLEYRFAT